MPAAAGGGAPVPNGALPNPTPVTPTVMGGPGDAAPTFLQDMGDGWRSLVSGSWTLPPAVEGYTCVRYTLPEAVSFKSLMPVAPPGTHHTVLTYDDAPKDQDGTFKCDAFTNGEHVLASSGVGTEATTPLPDGVSYQLPAGSQLVLNLHLFNATGAALAGRTGIMVTLANEGENIQAENMLAGPVQLMIPPGEVVQQGRCTFTGSSTIVEIFPHMHQVGRHMRVVAHSSIDGDQVLHDAAYDFEYQLFYPVGPVRMAAGDYVSVECTYQNDTGRMITWGDSSESEMCFAGLVRYPALGSNLGVACAN